MPTNLKEVSEREKDIRYAGRTRSGTEALRLKHDVRHNINALHEMLPPELKDTPEAKWLYNFGCVATMDIVRSSTARVTRKARPRIMSSAARR